MSYSISQEALCAFGGTDSLLWQTVHNFGFAFSFCLYRSLMSGRCERLIPSQAFPGHVSLHIPLKQVLGEGNGTPPHFLAWKIPWTEEPSRLQSMRSLRVGHDWETSLSLFTFMHWRRKWQHAPVFLPGESQGWWSLMGCRLGGRTESDPTEATQYQQSRC